MNKSAAQSIGRQSKKKDESPTRVCRVFFLISSNFCFDISQHDSRATSTDPLTLVNSELVDGNETFLTFFSIRNIDRRAFACIVSHVLVR